MTYLWALLAAAARNLRIARRRPDLIVQTVAVPVVVLGLASIIFGATDAWPVAVVDDDHSAASAEFVQALHDTRGVSGEYFRVVTTDAATARNLVHDGRLHLAVHIPEGFAASNRVEVTTYNINTDATKNVRLRIVETANLFDAVTGDASVSAVLRTVRPDSVPRAAFMGGSAILLALLLGSVLIAANLFAMEQEIRTTKELILTPVGATAGALGAAVAAMLLALVTSAPTAVMAWLFGFRPEPAGAGAAVAVAFPAMLAAAGTGVLVAHMLRTHRAIQPAVILAALASYFAAGGFIPVAGLPPAARAFAAFWPPSFVFEWVNPLLHGFAGAAASGRQVAMWLAGAAGAGLAAWSGVREARRPAGGGQ